MFPRDRYQEFCDLHNQNIQKDEDIFSTDLHDVMEKRKLSSDLNDFLVRASFLQKRLSIVKTLIAKLRRKQVDILTSSFIKKSDEQERDDMLKEIKKNITFVYKDINTLERTMTLDNSDLIDTRQMNRQDKMRKDQLFALRLTCQELLQEFDATELDYREHCKSRIRRQLEICGEKKSNEDVEKMLESGDINIFKSQLLLDTEKSATALKDVQDRHREILKLESSIHELQDLFQDISMLVEMQGEMLDNIERNAAETAQCVVTMGVNLKKATKYKKKRLFIL